jgi:periplasmic copper chaperone A
MKKHITAFALTTVAILALAPGVLANDVMVISGFARASAAPQASAAAAYVTLANRGKEADQLVGVTSPAAAMAHLHQSKTQDGVASMVPVETLELGAGAFVEMKPGGLHIMLMSLKAPLKQGESLTLELEFAKAGKVTVTVPIKGVAATGP